MALPQTCAHADLVHQYPEAEDTARSSFFHTHRAHLLLGCTSGDLSALCLAMHTLLAVADDMQHWRRHNQALSFTPIRNACTDLHIAQLAGASNFDVAISSWLCSSITTQSAYFAGSIWAYRAG